MNGQTGDKKISSNNYYKRSMARCVQNYVDKGENSNGVKNTNDKTNSRKNRDFVPVTLYLTLDNLANPEKRSEHRRHNLAP